MPVIAPGKHITHGARQGISISVWSGSIFDLEYNQGSNLGPGETFSKTTCFILVLLHIVPHVYFSVWFCLFYRNCPLNRSGIFPSSLMYKVAFLIGITPVRQFTELVL